MRSPTLLSRKSEQECRKCRSISVRYDLLMEVYLDDQIDVGQFVTSRVQTDGVQDTFRDRVQSLRLRRAWTPPT